LRKRPTFHRHIDARRRERRVQRELEQGSRVPLPGTPSNVAEPPLLQDDFPIPPASLFVGAQQITQRPHSLAEDLHDWILGGQDGVVNVLGSILGVAIVTSDKRIILVAGLAALLAESISMAAVAYTSVKASKLYYDSERERLVKAIGENPVLQREILIDIYERKGLARPDAHRVVTELTKDREVWLETLIEEHLHLPPQEDSRPLRSAMMVGTSAIIGSTIPLLPFIFMVGMSAVYTSVAMSVTILFLAGAASAKLTIGDWKARGIEMALIGGAAALVSFAIGYAFSHGIIRVS
jgi:VIT1/CCC1 family predicted Fe2+/Mn2+ transporter